MTAEATAPKSLKIAAGVITATALALAATGAYILIVPLDENDFESTTGVAWDTFASANPEIAEYLIREARILAVGFLGLMLVVAAIARSRLRAADPWAARVLWLFPSTLWAASAVFFTGGGTTLGAMYLVVGLIVAAALVAARRSM